jgi:hypothetical protein
VTAIKRLPGETKEEARLRAQAEWRAAEPARKREEEESRRQLCTGLTFWRVCRHKQCNRQRACAGDADRCFTRFWPMVPEETKTYFRAYITASARDKLSHHEANRQARAEVARYLEMEARFARQKAEQAAAQAAKFAQPQPQYVPEDRAPRIRNW